MTCKVISSGEATIIVCSRGGPPYGSARCVYCGSRLGLRPHEFVWCDADGKPRVLPPDPAAAAVWAGIYADWSGYRDRYNEIAAGIPGAEVLR